MPKKRRAHRGQAGRLPSSRLPHHIHAEQAEGDGHQKEGPVGYGDQTTAKATAGVPGALQGWLRWGRAPGTSSLGWEQTLPPQLHQPDPLARLRSCLVAAAAAGGPRVCGGPWSPSPAWLCPRAALLPGQPEDPYDPL